MSRPQRERRRYNAVASEDDSTALPTEGTPLEVDRPAYESDSKSEASTLISEEEDVASHPDSFKVTILDFAQSTFEVAVMPSWTVRRFKKEGAAIHKVSPARQRLIYRGKLLTDEETLSEAGITEQGVIVHLFPKPRVVITNANEADDHPVEANGDEEEGAHVPTIVMDSSEAGRRAEILVLGSTEFHEAQNGVKIFSFLLLIVSAMDLLDLFGRLMGGSTNEETNGSESFPSLVDDFYSAATDHYGNTTGLSSPYEAYEDFDGEPGSASQVYDSWPAAEYVDTAISLICLYVAILGLKASSENTLRLARSYMIGLFIAGSLWLGFQYFMSVASLRLTDEEKQNQAAAHNQPYTPEPISEIYIQAFQAMLLLSLLWCMCCVRAWNFQRLLSDAEREANERIQSQLDLEAEDNEMDLEPENQIV